jgi:hypothetical protein
MPSSILNSDDGVISGTSGLKSSGGDDGVLVFQSKGTETARINTDKQIVAAAGTASLPALTTTGDVNTGIFFPAADTIAFAEGGAEAMRIDSNGNVGIGVTPKTYSNGKALQINTSALNDDAGGSFHITQNGYFNSSWKYVQNGTAEKITYGSGVISFSNASNNTSGADAALTWAERMRILSGGEVLFNNTTTSSTSNMMYFSPSVNEAHLVIANTIGSDNLALIYCNRQGADGKLIEFRQANITEGTISVSGSTVTYGGGHLARWGQLLDGSKDESLKKGTVLSNLDEMCVWSAPTTYWTEEDELPEGVNVGDVKQEAFTAENEQCNKIKVSDVEGDVNVAGVFVNWTYDEQFNSNDLFVAMTGDMIIRIAQGVTVARGDLLMSAGDGTAKPQGDDIVRSKTIAKVTSTHVTCTYDDGSYCVPCVLMAC